MCARGDDGAIQGVLPLVRFNSRPLGPKRLISLPFLDSAGILADGPEVASGLLNHAASLLRQSGDRELEIRRVGGKGDLPAEGAEALSDRINLVLTLAADEQAQWKALRDKVRNQCRKAERGGLKLAEGEPQALLDGFYEVFKVNMRDLGSPVHPKSLFAAVLRHFGDRVRLIVVHREGRPVGGLVAIHFGRRVAVPWASTLRSERQHCPNNMIYWEAIRWAIGVGAKEFDFGRSPVDGGTYRFKKGWGAIEEALVWERYDAQAQALPSAHASTSSTLFNRLSQVWMKLPVPLSGLLGPQVRRYFSN